MTRHHVERDLARKHVIYVELVEYQSVIFIVSSLDLMKRTEDVTAVLHQYAFMQF